ncbi:MAG: MFS transporter [Acetobacteraceae bacterium]|nr:MFS transporter [Acetobacteraceae bacterium]
MLTPALPQARPIVPRLPVVLILGTTQTLAWASSVYLPAVLAGPLAADLHVPTDWVFAAVSAALLLSALLSPALGRSIDRYGGRAILAGSNLVFAAGLLLLATASTLAGAAAAWALIGIGMAAGLYEAAFATVAALYGREARGAITGITLIGGFASTIGWPLTTYLIAAYGWRDACLTWAALHLLVGLPLNLLLPRAATAPSREPPPAPPAGAVPARPMILLIVAFTAVAFVTSAMAAHLPRLLVMAGMDRSAAIAAAALVGPAQVAARLAEFGLLRRLSARNMARLAASLHPAGAAALALVGAPAALVFTLLHGAGNGMLTIARGILPLALFGPDRYGARAGLLAAPARFGQAAAPLLFGLLLDRAGLFPALLLSFTLGTLATLALTALPRAS